MKAPEGQLKNSILMRAGYFLLYFAEALSYCLLISYLTYMGFDSLQRGIILSAGALCGTAAQFLVGYLCDRNHAIRRYVIWLMIIYILTGVLTYGREDGSFPYYLLMTGLMLSCYRALTAVFDSWVLESEPYISRSFGAIRAYGSAGWVAGSLLTSCIQSRMGYGGLALGFAAFTIILGVVCLLLPDAAKKSEDQISPKKLRLMLADRRYLTVIAALLCSFMMLSAADYIVVDKINALGGTETDVSLMWALVAVCELPLFFAGNRLVERWGAGRLFVVATVFYGIRFVLYGLSASVTGMLWLSLLQMVSFPLLTLSAKLLVAGEVRKGMESSGQQIAMALYVNLSAFAGPLVCGLLEKWFDVNAAIYFLAFFAVAALIIMRIYRRLAEGVVK